MANGFGSLYVGASGLQNSQNALNTTANNLANVNTTGYVREQVRFAEKHYNKLTNATPEIPMQQYGLGVSIGDVVHARDVFLDRAYRQETGRASFYETRYNAVAEVEDMFQELDGEEFKNSVTDFYVAFQELMKMPDDSTNQSLVVQKAELFLTRCTNLYTDLQNFQSNLNTQIKDAVAEINDIGNQIYDLNLQVQRVEVGGVETAMEVRDQRDTLLDELAKYGAINIREDQTGFVYVEFEGQTFVDDHTCYNIAMDTARGTGFVTPYWPQLSNVPANDFTEVFRLDVEINSEFNNDIGKAKALMLARGDGYGHYQDLADEGSYKKVEGSVVMETEAELDQLFHEMATAINDLLCPNIEVTSDISDGGNVIPAGSKILDVANCSYGTDGQLPPQELFSRIGCERYTKMTINGTDYYVFNDENPADTSTQYILGSVRTNDALQEEVTRFPAFTKNGAVNRKLAEDLAALWDDTDMRLNPGDNYPCSYTNYYDKMISKLATDGSTYYSQQETTANAATSVDNQRTQVTGVSSDEELTKMIRYQSAYNAASRFFTVISEMTELIVTGLI